MAWDGWFSYEGSEIINVARTEAYLRDSHWFRPVFRNEALPVMLDDDRYTTPLHDNAPWVDPDHLDSNDFYGFYPLGVAGIEDSTRSSAPTESLGDGGQPGAVRNGMKTIVFNGLLLGRTEASVEYGLRWLKQALNSGVCDRGCEGGTLCYLSSEPDMDLSPDPGVSAVLDGGGFAPAVPQEPDSTDGGTPYTSAEVTVDGGGVVDEQDAALDGGMPWYGGEAVSTGNEVQVDAPLLDGGGVTSLRSTLFDGGTPFMTGGILAGASATWPFNTVLLSTIDPGDCLEPYMRSLLRVTIVPGPTVDAKRELSDGSAMWNVQFTALVGNPAEFGSEVPVIEGFLDPAVDIPWVGGVVPEDASYDDVGYIAVAEECAPDVSEPIYDPLFPAAILPPTPPNVPLGHFSPPLNWLRRQITIPKTYVPTWGQVVPKVEIHARTADLRNLRLRFYADPYRIGDISDDPCSYCGDIIVSYVPRDHTMVLDGPEQRAYVVSPGGTERSADSLLFASDGTPFDWPELTCGFGYVVTLDLPQTQAPPVVDLSLFAKAV